MIHRLSFVFVVLLSDCGGGGSALPPPATVQAPMEITAFSADATNAQAEVTPALPVTVQARRVQSRPHHMRARDDL
jgi:hypothetical protein